MTWNAVRYTDFISERQIVQFWAFDYTKLKKNENSDYSQPVRSVLFSIFKRMNESLDKHIRLRHFTVWIGDYGDTNQFFCIGIPFRMHNRVAALFKKYLESLAGFEFWNYDRLPTVPLIPMYRYEYGKIIEYIHSKRIAGKYKIDIGKDGLNTGLTVQYRICECAEGFDIKQMYRG